MNAGQTNPRSDEEIDLLMEAAVLCFSDWVIPPETKAKLLKQSAAVESRNGRDKIRIYLSPKKLTDEQCWKICQSIMPDPEEQKTMPRQMVPYYMRKWLDANRLDFGLLDNLAGLLFEKDEPVLGIWVEALAQSYRDGD